MNRPEDTSTPRPFRFGLRELLMLPVVVAALGAVGVLVAWEVAFVLLPIPIGILLFRFRLLSGGDTMIIVLIVMIVLAILLPPVEAPRSSARREQCGLNIKQIMLALHEYHDVYGAFPPAYLADAEGRPMHSWRVLILPFLGRQDLYELYDFSQPWNSPANRSLMAQAPLDFMCPSDTARAPGDASYFLVAGDGTPWASGHAPSIEEFTGRPAERIVLVEVANSGIPWTEPRDISLNEALLGVGTGGAPRISSPHPGGAQTGRLDGSVWFLLEQTRPKELRRLLAPPP